MSRCTQVAYIVSVSSANKKLTMRSDDFRIARHSLAEMSGLLEFRGSKDLQNNVLRASWSVGLTVGA